MKNQFFKTFLSLIVCSILLFGCSDDDIALTIPPAVSNLTAIPGGENVLLTWTKPANSNIKEYWLKYEPGNALVSIDKDFESYTVTDIPGNVPHTFILLVKNESGGISEGTSVISTPNVIDNDAPSEVSNFTAVPDNAQVTLTWSKPLESDLAGYVLTYEPGNGSEILSSEVESFVISSLTNDTEYTFTIKSKDALDNISVGTSVKATPKEGDNTPPAEITGVEFSGDYDNLQFTMNWANPTDADFEELELTYSYGSVDDVVVTIPKTENSYTVDGSYENNYTLVIKTKDENGNYSTGVTKKIRFGNFSPGSQEDINNGFDQDIVAILAGKLKLSGTDASDLSKFSNLELVEGKFDIVSNVNLTSLDGLAKLSKVTRRIVITDNTALANFCGLKNLLNLNGESDEGFTVTGNASNPTKQDILDTCN